MCLTRVSVGCTTCTSSSCSSSISSRSSRLVVIGSRSSRSIRSSRSSSSCSGAQFDHPHGPAAMHCTLHITAELHCTFFDSGATGINIAGGNSVAEYYFCVWSAYHLGDTEHRIAYHTMTPLPTLGMNPQNVCTATFLMRFHK